MLKNVKSFYFTKIVFSFLNDKLKLDFVKYNKKMQAYLDLDINHYKLFAGKYIIYEGNKKGKEYDFNNKLIFEGEYLNRKKHGKGKLYNNSGDLIFEGNYFNGKRNGKGKGIEILEGFNDSHTLIFEGEYRNDKKWNGNIYQKDNKFFANNNSINEKKRIYEIKEGNGILKTYNIFSQYLLSEAEFKNGELNGKCKEYYPNEILLFEGEYKNGKKWNGKGYDIYGNIIFELNNGKGHIKIYFLNGDDLIKSREINIFEVKDQKKILYSECDYLNGELNGIFKKYFFSGKLMLEQEYKGGKKNGKIKEYYPDTDQLIFEGEYLYDRKIKGKEYIKGRLEYEGEYFFDKKWNGKGYDENGNIIYELKNGTGKVKYYDDNGNLEFDGEYLNGEENGMTKEYYGGRLYFEGYYIKGKRNGKGKKYNHDGHVIYDGEYLNDKKNGKGKIYNSKGKLLYEGGFLEGKKNGKGKEYNDEGQVIYEGEYSKGMKIK